MLKKQDNLDERQALIRNDIFKHAFLTLVFSGFAVEALRMFELVSEEGGAPYLFTFCVALSVLVLSVEMIRHDIYPISEKTQRFTYILLGVCGFALTALNIYELASGELTPFIAGSLNSSLFSLGTGILFLLPVIWYTIHKLQQKKEPQEDA